VSVAIHFTTRTTGNLFGIYLGLIEVVLLLTYLCPITTSLNCITMSEDASLIAGGFSESYVKIWSLKGEKLRSLKNNITPAKVNDCKRPSLMT
jgi:hypothetical protein